MKNAIHQISFHEKEKRQDISPGVSLFRVLPSVEDAAEYAFHENILRFGYGSDWYTLTVLARTQ